MKKLLFLLILCSVFGACNNDEMERLKKENETLKVQINILRGSELSKSKNATEVTSEKKASTGYSLKKLRMDIDKNKHSMVISVKPVLLYNSLFLEKNKQDIYAFEMDDASNPGAITGYCYKNNSNCKELFNKLRENSKCIVSLDAWYPDKVFNEDRLLGVHAEIGNIKIQKCTNGYF